MPDLAAIRAYCEAVKQHIGGWAWRRRVNGSKFADGTPVCEVVAADRTIIAYDVGEPEARFIAAARTDLPAVVEALEKAQAVLAKAKRQHNWETHGYYEGDEAGCLDCQRYADVL